MNMWGKKVTFDRTLEIILELRSQISKSAPDADNCSIERVWIILLLFLFYNQIMQIICIVESVKGVYIHVHIHKIVWMWMLFLSTEHAFNVNFLWWLQFKTF